MSVDLERLGEEIADSVFANRPRATTISRSKLAKEVGEIAVQVCAPMAQDVTGEDILRAVTATLERNKGRMDELAETTSSDCLNAMNNCIRSVSECRRITDCTREYIPGAIEVKDELARMLERYEALKREPNETTKSVGAEPGHFTCLICGSSMGKISIGTGGDWEWVTPNYCPNCGGKVTNAGQHGADRNENAKIRRRIV